MRRHILSSNYGRLHSGSDPEYLTHLWDRVIQGQHPAAGAVEVFGVDPDFRYDYGTLVMVDDDGEIWGVG